MALKNIRINNNETIVLNEAFQAHGSLKGLTGGTIVSIIVDGREVEFTQQYDKQPETTTEQTSEGVWSHQIRIRAEAKGYYDEAIHLQIRYSTFVDAVYRRARPERSCFTLEIVNTGELKYPPEELYALVAGTFNTN